jgi:predicted metalloprotease with PDZ domain
LVVEAHVLFGAWPYRRYRFLLALSEVVPHGGLEHHECSDNRAPERTLVDEAPWTLRAGLLPHELVHAWNGKHRRPEGLVTRDFQQPMRTELLWIYEGLSTYLGEVLTARAGLRTLAEARDALAYSTATQDACSGRTWRSLADTAISAPVLTHAVREWRSLRRGLDYYPESQLIWLEADEVIRSESKGQRSLDDFCRAFFGRTARGLPAVVPYSLDDFLRGLAEICPHPWREFFQARVYATTPHPPLVAIEQAGWNLSYVPEPTSYFRHIEEATKELDYTFSLGIVLKHDGTILDVVEGRPAALAGIAPAGRLIAVNGRKFSKESLRAAVGASAGHAGVALLVENDGFFRTHDLAHSAHWKGGHRYPTLTRNERLPDLLSVIWGASPPPGRPPPLPLPSPSPRRP